MFRYFLHNGQPTDRVDSYGDASVLSPDVDAAQEVATALGVDVSTVSVQHGTEPPSPVVTIPPASQPVSPDPNGFLLAALGALGLATGNALLAKWPTFTVALNAANWSVTRQVLDAALQAGDVTQGQHDTLAKLLADHYITEA